LECYLHRIEIRTDRQAKFNTFYAVEKGFTQTKLQSMEDLEKLSTAELEPAYTSQAFMTVMVMNQKIRPLKRKKEENGK
jgi:hypothetical protein